MGDFIEAMKDDPIILGASIAVAVLLLIIVILIITLIVGARKDKKKMKAMQQKGKTNNQFNPQMNSMMGHDQYGQVQNNYPDNSNASNSYLQGYAQQTVNNQQQPNYGNAVQTKTEDLVQEPVQQDVSKSGSALSGCENVELTVESSSSQSNETVLLVEAQKTLPPYIVCELNGESKKFIIDRPITAVGRDAENCEIVVDFDLHIGRKHALIYKKEDSYVLVDLGSKNGTFVNDEKLQGERVLRDGDKIKLATTEVVFRIN